MTTELISQVCNTIKSAAMQQQISQALPPGVSIDRFTRTTLVAIQTNPSVLEADRQSLYNALVRAAQDGLLVDGREGAIVTFKTKDKATNAYVKKAQFMPMVYGIIQQLGKAGIDAHANSVYEGENCEIWTDEHGQHIKHMRNPFAETRKMIGVYAVGITKAGNAYIEAMNMADINAVRARSKSPDEGPWADSYDRMAQKAALHRLAKRMPITNPEQRAALENVLKSDEETFASTQALEAPTQSQAQIELKRPAVLQSVIDQQVEQPASGGDDFSNAAATLSGDIF